MALIVVEPVFLHQTCLTGLDVSVIPVHLISQLAEGYPHRARYHCTIVSKIIGEHVAVVSGLYVFTGLFSSTRSRKCTEIAFKSVIVIIGSVYTGRVLVPVRVHVVYEAGRVDHQLLAVPAIS